MAEAHIMVVNNPEDYLPSKLIHFRQQNIDVNIKDVEDIYMNIYLHNRLKQWDPEIKVSTAIYRKLIYDRATNFIYFKHYYDMVLHPDFEEIDLLIKNKIKGL